MTGLALALALAVAAGGCAAVAAPDPTVMPTATPASTIAPVVTSRAASPEASAPASSEGTIVGPGEAWIAFQGSGLELIRPDGTGRHRLYPSLTGGEHLHPDWSPDGERIVFSIRAATDEIWIGDVDGTGTERLIPCADPCRWVDEPAWSPDGRSIAFHRMVLAEGGIGISTLEILVLASGDLRVVATAPGDRSFYAPRWSPDGSQIVAEFVHRSSTAADADVISDALAIVDPGDGDLTEITEAEDRCNNPDWGWTNDRILCSKPVSQTGFDGPSYLLSLATDGSDAVPLTPMEGPDAAAVHATWLPDGSGAIFIDGAGTMAVAAADGTGVMSATGKQRIAGYHPRVRPTAGRQNGTP
jgi:Tol biopolymer transport system component